MQKVFGVASADPWQTGTQFYPELVAALLILIQRYAGSHSGALKLEMTLFGMAQDRAVKASTVSRREKILRRDRAVAVCAKIRAEAPIGSFDAAIAATL